LLEVKIQVYTISGKIIKTITTKISSEGFLVNDIIWDGKDEYGDNIGNGVYVYSVEVQSEDGTSRALQFEKLVLLK
jgi:flagellar hook assembly protein FlgD